MNRPPQYSLPATNSYNVNNFNGVTTPPRIESKNILFENAKYHVVIENTSRPNWITEKLIDSLATKTIPIYWGCPNVGDFFNEEGILTFNNMDELNTVLNSITPEFYDEMKDVIEENYEKSKEYYNFHERVEREVNTLIHESI